MREEMQQSDPDMKDTMPVSDTILPDNTKTDIIE
jgi:hypothetical protein